MPLLDAAEAGLRRAARALARPGPFAAASVALLVLGLLVRLPLAAEAREVCCAHPDSWVYFHQSYAEYIDGNLFPDNHRGSGWQLLFAGVLVVMGFEKGGDGWSPYMQEMTGDDARAAAIAQTLSALLGAGVIVAAILLARQLMPAAGALTVGALVAFDPMLLRIAPTAMSEPLYVPVFVLATLTTLLARRHRAWLLATAALMAVGHMLRVNGLVMFGMLGVYALLLLRDRPAAFLRGMWRPGPDRRLALWGVAAVATFFVVAAPYLAWREVDGHGAFDYGTNQRFWADSLWNMSDAWWQAENAGARIERETAADYFATHTLGEAATQLWQSIAWQVFDLVGSGRYPAGVTEGGAFVGSPREPAAVTPLLAGLTLVAAFTVMRRREWWFLPLALLFTFLTFLWIYPLVRSVRYWAPVVPFFALAAVAGGTHLAATLTRRPYLVAAGIFGAYLALYGLPILLKVPVGIAFFAANADVRVLTLVVGAGWCVLALGPYLKHLVLTSRAGATGRAQRDQ